MCADKDGLSYGIRAALKWLWGTDEECRTAQAQEEAVKVANPPKPEMDPFDAAMNKIDRMERSLHRASVIVPARSLDEALTMIAERKR
jgi:hypothetical protein